MSYKHSLRAQRNQALDALEDAVEAGQKAADNSPKFTRPGELVGEQAAIFDASSNNFVQWRHVWQWVLSHKKALVWAHIIAAISMVLTAPIPLLIPVLVDEVLLNQPGWLLPILQSLAPETWHGATYYIVVVTLITLVMRFGGMLSGIVQMRLFTGIAKQVTYRIRVQLLNHLQHISLGTFTSLGSGKVVTHVVTDVDTLDNFLGQSIGKVLLAGFSLLGAAIILLWIHWQLALVILLLNPLVIYFTFAAGRRVRSLKKKENAAISIFQEALVETLDGLLQVRAASREQAFFDRLRGFADGIRASGDAFAWKSEAASRISFLIFLVGFDIFRGLGLLVVVFSDLSIGEMMAVFGYLWYMMGPVNEMLSVHYSYMAADGALSRMNELMGTELEKQNHQGINPFGQGKPLPITLENIHFGYLPGQEVLKGVSFTIEPGEKVALVGASGGGKTTLVQLLLAFYRPQAGNIAVGGVDLNAIDLQALRQEVAVVLQNPVMFNASIRENLDLGRGLADEQLYKVLEVAQLQDFVAGLPQGLDSRIGRDGLKISGGQRQRLAIARMMLQDPQVVILDEATSALDLQTEEKLHRALEAFLQNRTTIIVAHRLSAIRQAQRALVFDQGQLVEEGHPDELMQQGGQYAQMLSLGV